MSSHFPKILEIAGPARINDSPKFPENMAPFVGKKIADLSELLNQVNGFWAFESALQVFPSHADSSGLDVVSWNSLSGWKAAYDDRVQRCLFFAQDAFGFQFGIEEDGVFHFNPEISEFTFIAKDVGDWWQMILIDYEHLTGHASAREWQLLNRPVRWEERLFPKCPFFLGGNFDVDNLFPMNGRHGAEFRAEIYSQTKDLPEGTQVRIRMDKSS